MKINQLILKNVTRLLRVLPEGQARIIRNLYNSVYSMRIVLYPSFLCNYKCPYCINNKQKIWKKYTRKMEHGWKDWIEIFNKLPRAKIYIVGGEPLLYPDLVQLINNMPRKHMVSISTNLSLPLDKFLNNLKRDIIISASFHPDTADTELFKKQVLKLKKHGFSTNVYVVAHPSIVPLLPKLKTFFEKEAGAGFNVDPYIEPDSYTIHRYTQKEIETIKKCRIKFSSNESPYGLDDNELKRCNAGSKYFIFASNGDVYACHSGLYLSNNKKLFLGNLFDGSFKPLKKVMKCSRPCHSCDMDFASVKKA